MFCICVALSGQELLHKLKVAPGYVMGPTPPYRATAWAAVYPYDFTHSELPHCL